VLASDFNGNRNSNGNASNNTQMSDQDRKAASRTAWGTLISMVLAILAASFAGSAGARDDRYDGGVRTRDDRGDVGGITPAP
jgi:hypothetical protein